MATLNDDVKAFIVQALACYDTPSQVVDAVKEEFGLEVSRMQVQAYDPTKAQGKALSQKWRDVFAATRDSFVKATAEIPIATQAYRLRVLNRLVSKAEKQGNMGMVSQLLEQAAKETGGMFVNRLRGDTPDDTPPAPKTFTFKVQDARRPGDDPDGDD
ncbi:DUF2280 domain-containing protein [Cupriavidus pauculus]|uniref:DUF2280 domain-containing protein n=1 Tax=Cupriavidus pauculus TaxID=82633 RepID=A0A3G8H5X5_9BURK|nr:DUF2280 domain-containing protein [Cupriavidus pauculus]AZG14942.1 DUF2280 domain-containing protein [Cupriavidus pauculus]